MTNSYPESRDMTISGKSPCQKVVKFYLYCHNFLNNCPKSIKIVYLGNSNHNSSDVRSLT